MNKPAPNKITAANAGWRLQFRFAGHVIGPAWLSSVVGRMPRRVDKVMSARNRIVYAVCIAVGVAVAVLDMLWQMKIAHDFSQEAASLAPGTEIRPMGVAMAQGVAGLGGVFFGICCAVPAVILSWKGRSWLRVALALLVLVLTVTLSVAGLFVGRSAVLHIVEVSGLVLEE